MVQMKMHPTTTTGTNDDDEENQSVKSGGVSVGVSVRSTSHNSHMTSYSSGADEASLKDRSESYVNPVVASKEQKAVILARLVVAAVLVLALAAVTGTMYWVISSQERKEFETQFDTFASEISSLVQENCKSAIAAAESFSTMVTSEVQAAAAAESSSSSSWPHVTVVDFTSKAARLSKLSGAYQVGFGPLVYPPDFAGWANHSRSSLPAYYEEAIRVNGYDATVPALLNQTIPYPWVFNTSTGVRPVDPLEPATPVQLVGLRERIGFHGFWPSWQSLTWLEPYAFFIGITTTNFELLQAGFEDAFATAYEFNIPAFDMYRNPVVDPFTRELLRWDIQTLMVQPVFDTIYNGQRSRKELQMVGALSLLFDWSSLLSNLLSKGDIQDVEIVLRSTCSLLARPVTYRVTAQDVIQVGSGEDLHDAAYDAMGVTTSLFHLELDRETQTEIDQVMAQQIEASVEGGCISEIIMDIYPTRALEESFYTGTAWKFSAGVAAVFVFTSLVFFVYDITVKRRQSKVMERIIRQDKIVLNTFPKAIRDRLYAEEEQKRKNREGIGFSGESQRSLSGTSDSTSDLFGSAGQLADLYPSATIVFADIVGFTAWSSAREPNQVFKLLETIYREFDKLSYRHNIFKVETVGDCYVAVAGVPGECKDHALAVARFARACMHKMPDLVRKLEILLGPDTADLQLRIGLNSGQVTAGVLRGDKARFQLFGDTVNVASRMESTSQAGCIQVSASTADALFKAGRKRWLKPRQDTVHVKGKGEMQTYYLETLDQSIQRSKLVKYKKRRSLQEATTTLDSIIIEESSEAEADEPYDVEEDIFQDETPDDLELHRSMSKLDRLVEWNVEILSFLLKQILVARRPDLPAVGKNSLTECEDKMRGGEESPRMTVLDEFKEIIVLPTVGRRELLQRKHPNTVTLDPVVISQLRDLLRKIANFYNENPFHNFEHASHVTASVRKLLTRIVDANHNNGRPSNLVDGSGHSYGITSDPLTQFAVVFSAVIHDAEHPGVPNAQLVRENTRHAQIYKKSIAEQNSVQIVWELLMSPAYEELRRCIYSNEEELKRFRQLVVNVVMATDIVDKELQALRKARWAKAFSPPEESAVSNPQLDTNRKATIVIEHLIQASDVSHTMQHWTIYRKWNERFFFELYDAYKNGRAEADPSVGWYKGEIGFFDFYIIPLAKKLENCGVFGVSSDEYLGYAQSNREQWVREGQQAVEEYLENYAKWKDELNTTGSQSGTSETNVEC